MTICRCGVFLGFLASVAHKVSAKLSEPAWNGHTTDGSRTPSLFTPYYVPPGAKGYDSASPLVFYTGEWADSFSAGYVQHSLRTTSQENASVWLTFKGTGIEWFGNTDKRHGVVNIFIDGRLCQVLDTWSARDVSLKQQRLFWNYDLPFGNTIMDVDAFIVTRGVNTNHLRLEHIAQQYSVPSDRLSPNFLQASSSAQNWILTQNGSTGVHAMQLTIVSPSHALIVDKVEHNPLTISGHPAWAALYNLDTHSLRPLSMKSNSFCASGTFLGNGTLIVVGGNPVVETQTSSADFGDADGLQAIRIFEPCESFTADGCEMYENHAHLRMASPRWYATAVRLSDGSAGIIGGSKKGGWMNNATVNNPTIEYYPPKDIHKSGGLPITLPFLVDTLNSNLFPIAFSLPNGNIFIAANRDAMIYDWSTDSERRLPRIPNGVRVTYPMTGTGILLPLISGNNYAPEVLLCGGSTIDDQKPSFQISSQDVASAQCSRLLLSEEGIAAGWEVESMPEARIMADAVLLPTGQVLIVNGGGSGISGYGNVQNQVGASNADHPVLTPILYNPSAPKGERFSSEGLPTSDIPRLYHSVATLTPAGDVMIAGSNPNLDRSEIRFGTEYRVEWLSPPYMRTERPVIVDSLKRIGFGQKFELRIKTSSQYSQLKVALMDLGYVTHGVHANSRLVYLETSNDTRNSVVVTAPPNGSVYPPGPGWVFLIVDDGVSRAVQVLIGDGQSPPLDNSASERVLKTPIVNQHYIADHEETE